MKILAKALLRLDGLSHVLAWTRDPVLACKDPASLDFVELPRLKLRFEAKPDGPGGKVRLTFSFFFVLVGIFAGILDERWLGLVGISAGTTTERKVRLRLARFLTGIGRKIVEACQGR